MGHYGVIRLQVGRAGFTGFPFSIGHIRACTRACVRRYIPEIMEKEFETVSSEKLTLVSFRGMILPMTKEEYQRFLEDLEEWNN